MTRQEFFYFQEEVEKELKLFFELADITYRRADMVWYDDEISYEFFLDSYSNVIKCNLNKAGDFLYRHVGLSSIKTLIFTDKDDIMKEVYKDIKEDMEALQ